MRFFSLISACICLLLFVETGRGADAPPSSKVTMHADSLTYDRQNSTYRAEGKVELIWNGVTLFADRANFAEQMGLATADGKVRMVKGDDILTGERISVNIPTGLGEALDAELFVKSGNFHIKGKRIAKTGDEDYRLERGSFTTCDGERPSWKFTASDLDVTLDEFARGRNAVFYLADIPVFYTPYMIFPIRRERQSGFLFPRLGSSTKKGFFIDIPYYWAISSSQELTTDLDLQSRRGVGAGLDFRYLGRDESKGSLRAYGIYDNEQERSRGILVGQQLENRREVTFRSDVSLAADRSFYRDFGESSGEYNRQLLDSSASVTVAGKESSLAAELRYVTDLEVADNGTTLQKLPQLNFTLLNQRLGPLPIYAGIGAGFTNFQRDIGSEGQRIDIRPRLTTHIPFPGGELSAWGGYRERFYNASNAGQADGTKDAGLLEGGATLSTTLSRVYSPDWGNLQRIRHLLVPEVSYSFTEEKGADRLPFFDFDDRPVGQGLLGWGLSNYISGRFATPDGSPLYRDLFMLRVSQGYQLSGGRRDLLTLVDDGNRLTDLKIESRLTPLPMWGLTLDNRYNTDRGRVSTVGTGLEFTDNRGTSAAFVYRYAREQLDYLEMRGVLPLVKPFLFQYTGRYSLDKGGFLESFYSMEYRHQCWSIAFSYRDRPDNREFLVSFSLSGIGSLGQVKAF